MNLIVNKIKDLSLSFDTCFRNRDVIGTFANIETAIKMIEHPDSTEEDKLSLYYSLGTAHSDLWSHLISDINNEKKEELQELAIYYYRAAIDTIETLVYDEKDINILAIHQQLYTNAGIAYASHGRYIEAFRLYSKAQKFALFPMAMAQKSFKSLEFSLYFYDVGQAQCFQHYAYLAAGKTLEYKEYIFHHSEHVIQELNMLRKSLSDFYDSEFLEGEINFGDYKYGKSKRECDYKVWCAIEKLFLNPLNEITDAPIVAHDFIHLPTMRYDFKSKKVDFHYGLFNQIVQEFVSARFLFYDGTKIRNKAQDADKNVLLIEVECNVVSHADYCIRTAFKTLYSILDRIAYFINDYFCLGINAGDVSFRYIWKDKIKSSRRDKKEIAHPNPLIGLVKENEMLKSIYWLSKDIYEENYKTTKPKSKHFDKLRNYLEHRYVASTLSDINTSEDDLSYYISTSDLYKTTLEMLRITREAIIYLSFAIHIEEKEKAKQDDKEGKTFIKQQKRAMKDDWK